MIAFHLLIKVMKVICDSVVMLTQELRLPIFLEGIFGLTHIDLRFSGYVATRGRPFFEGIIRQSHVETGNSDMSRKKQKETKAGQI
jgi:hypothetical protein